MKRFDTSGWVYGPQLRVLRQLPEAVVKHLPRDEIMMEMAMGGGKSLSLRICDIIAHRSKQFSVPNWMALSVSEQIQSARLSSWCQISQDTKVRSSTLMEDWLSGESGQHSSRRAKPSLIRDTIREITQWNAPVVLQRYVEGIGIVVDIGWSDVLAKPILRVATGREASGTNGDRVFTSATWDHEGLYEIFDPEDAMCSLAPTHSGKIQVGSCRNIPLRAIARELWRHVCDLGFYFGVQIELSVHPDHPEKWNLLQIRPSPNTVRCEIPVSGLIDPIVTTPLISGPFNIQALAESIRSKDTTELMTIGAGLEVKASKGQRRRAPILLWETDPSEVMGHYQLLGAKLSGAALQITRQVIISNTVHGRVRTWTQDQENVVLQGSGLIAIPDEVHAHLVEQLKNGAKRIHAISDGLVGQLALL